MQLEVGSKRTFASALDWPGWSRAGRDEPAAIAALAAAAHRYRAAVASAGIALPVAAQDSLLVVERTPGNATTDFGAPGQPAFADRAAVAGTDLNRLLDLLKASWTEFDRVIAGAPAELRKGPRGGGRDRDQIAEHVLGAETSYGRSIGVKLNQPPPGDASALTVFRESILGALRDRAAGWRPGDRGWPVRYAARRIAWHVLDHAWEMEDRSTQLPSGG